MTPEGGHLQQIDRFDGEFRFLSNFSPHPVFIYSRGFPTAEHAFQASKTAIPAERDWVASQSTPGRAKRAGSMKGLGGRRITIIQGWNDVRVSVMRIVVRKKFLQHPDIAELLIATGDAELIEGNWWNDKFWGVCNGEGENHLGLILMEIRKELQ